MLLQVSRIKDRVKNQDSKRDYQLTFERGEFKLDKNNGICEIKKRAFKKKVGEHLSTNVSWKFNGHVCINLDQN